MTEVHRTLEQMNAAQQRTIVEQLSRIKELEQWEKFAAHLINHCVGQTITVESLEKWLHESQTPKRL